MKAIKNGQLYLNGQLFTKKVLIYDKTIVDIVEEEALSKYTIEEMIDAKGEYIVPGFIDVHIHGYKGIDIMDEDKEGLQAISMLLTQSGVTSFLPTTMTMAEPTIRGALDKIKDYMLQERDGAHVLGVHLEGPFISEAFKGAQSKEHILLPKEVLLKDYKNIIKRVTIAPEVEGAIQCIQANKSLMAFSLGHTGASYDIAQKAIKEGASSVTHLFNAMTGLHHREPGVVGAALISDVYCELIADHIHVHKDLYKLILKTKGVDKILLITDCMRAGGLSDGEYDLGGQAVSVKQGKCLLADGTLAGSTLRLNKALKNFMQETELGIEEAIKLVTENPARHIQVYDSKGSLDKGKDADIVILNKDIDIIKTIVKGKMTYEI